VSSNRKSKPRDIPRTFDQTAATLQPHFDFTIEELQGAIAEIARRLCPVVDVADGSGRFRQIGTAFVVGQPSAATIITAEHVVSVPQATGVVWPSREVTRWDDRYSVLRAHAADVPEADIAIMHGSISDGAEPIECIPLHRLRPDLPVAPGTFLAAVGFPASRGKIVASQYFTANTFHILGFAADLSTLPGGPLDPRVHLAIRYHPEKMRELTGAQRRGVKPDGMSGGVLLAPSRVRLEDGTAKLTVDIVGVLVRYRPASGVLIATRIGCLTAAMSSRSSEPFRLVRTSLPH
jgi:hypothetical protein